MSSITFEIAPVHDARGLQAVVVGPSGALAGSTAVFLAASEPAVTEPALWFKDVGDGTLQLFTVEP